MRFKDPVLWLIAIMNASLDRFRPLANQQEVSQLCEIYYSEYASAQTQVSSLLIYAHSPMGPITETTEEKSGVEAVTLNRSLSNGSC